MILTTKTDALIDAVEIQKDVYELGKKSIELNNLQDRINIINEDIKEYSKNMETDTYDVITSLNTNVNKAISPIPTTKAIKPKIIVHLRPILFATLESRINEIIDETVKIIVNVP